MWSNCGARCTHAGRNRLRGTGADAAMGSTRPVLIVLSDLLLSSHPQPFLTFTPRLWKILVWPPPSKALAGKSPQAAWRWSLSTRIADSRPREVSLSLFRVAQEAVHKAIKYSGQMHLRYVSKQPRANLNLRSVMKEWDLMPRRQITRRIAAGQH